MARGSYIKTLQRENEAHKAALKTLNDGIWGVMSYLYSDKFSQDTTVQVNDVISRLNEIKAKSDNAMTEVLSQPIPEKIKEVKGEDLVTPEGVEVSIAVP